MTNKELLEIVDKACAEYEDGHTGVTECLRLYLIHHKGISDDDDSAFELAHELSTKHTNLMAYGKQSMKGRDYA